MSAGLEPDSRRLTAGERSAKRPARLAAAAGALLILSACEPPAPAVVSHPEWVIHSRVSFVGADLVTPREALPTSAFRLSFPYAGGRLYGPPSIADLLHPQVNSDYGFVIDLNATQADLSHSAQEFAEGQEYLRIDPAEARIARLMPEALEPDGPGQIAAADWVDTRTHAPLMLVYFDRPARITGVLNRDGHTTRYNIRASQAGYVWIGYALNADGERMYREVDWPGHLVLALAPKSPEGEHPSDTPVPEAPADTAGGATSSAAASSSGASAHSQSAAALEQDLRGTESPRQAAARTRGTPAR